MRSLTTSPRGSGVGFGVEVVSPWAWCWIPVGDLAARSAQPATVGPDWSAVAAAVGAAVGQVQGRSLTAAAVRAAPARASVEIELAERDRGLVRGWLAGRPVIYSAADRRFLDGAGRVTVLAAADEAAVVPALLYGLDVLTLREALLHRGDEAYRRANLQAVLPVLRAHLAALSTGGLAPLNHQARQRLVEAISLLAAHRHRPLPDPGLVSVASRVTSGMQPSLWQ